jgi:ADP-ribose pyrophosphatase YjhB (NUDIX family)
MKIITFDFDNTIAMSYMDTRGKTPVPVFQHYNDKIVKKIKKNIKEGNEIYIVTSRKEDLEPYFPEQSIPYHLKQLGLDDYFLPNRLFYTNGKSKYPILLKLKTEKHYDDDIEEHRDAWDSNYIVKQPLDGFKDSDIVGKTVIFDALDNVLILQRSDKGHLWDLPGGHVKNIEVSRVPDGIKDGTEREIFEETGLLTPFLKKFMQYDFVHRGIVHQINMFMTKLDAKEPTIRLDLQDHIENIDYKWVKLADLEGVLNKCTTNLRKAYDDLIIKDEIFEQNEPYQLKMKKKSRNGKRRLVGMGGNKHFGGGKGWKRADLSRPKSAPVGFGAIGEQKSMIEGEKWPKKHFKERILKENDEKNKKKVKIKVKIAKNLDEKRKKRRKSRKNRRKSRRNRAKNALIGGSWSLYDGDSGGDGAPGGE